MSHVAGCARIYLVAGLMYFAALLPVTATGSTDQEWRFTVYLDDTPIGQHNFSVQQAEGYEKMTTDARFDVTFLKIPLFKYRHQDVQHWSNQCLKSITSTTDQNGELFRVEGSHHCKRFPGLNK